MADPTLLTVETDGLSPEEALLVAEGVALSLEDLQALEEAAMWAEAEKQRILGSLAQDIDNKFTERRSRRTVKEGEWLESLRLYYGPLGTGVRRTTEDYFRDETTSVRRPEINLVRTKVQLAVAEGLSKQFGGGEKNWDLNPPIEPEPGLDRQQVDIAAENMEREIYDDLQATRYGPKSRASYTDRVILGTGILKGPLPDPFPRLTYEQSVNPETGQIVMVPKHVVQNRPSWFRVDPWMSFPDDTVTNIRDAEDHIELHPMSKTQLRALQKNPGFFTDTLEKLLKEEPREYINKALSDYSTLTNTGQNVYRNKYAMLEYHGPVSKDILDTLRIEPAYENELDVYLGEVWVCQGHVVRVELSTLDGLTELPYLYCPWEEDPGSVFGFGLPQILRDNQRAAQATHAMILENSSASSMPSVLIDKELVEPATGQWRVGPGEIYFKTDYGQSSAANAFQFFNVPNNTDKLMPVLDFHIQQAQIESSLPQMVEGLGSPQTGSDSATGLAILQQNSTIVSDYIAEQWDDNITEPVIRRTYHWIMQYRPRPEIIGDFEVDVRTSTELRSKQLAMRELEKLSVEAAQNPAIAEIINQPALQKARIAMMHINSASIIKSDEQIAEEQAQAAANPQPDPAMIKLEIDKQNADTNSQKIQLEFQRLQFEQTLEQQREVMQHQERMAANDARMREAEARVLEAQLVRETEMIKLAQSDEVARARIMADLERTSMQLETQKFLKGIEAQQRATDQQQTQEELRIKVNQGTGI